MHKIEIAQQQSAVSTRPQRADYPVAQVIADPHVRSSLERIHQINGLLAREVLLLIGGDDHTKCALNSGRCPRRREVGQGCASRHKVVNKQPVRAQFDRQTNALIFATV